MAVMCSHCSHVNPDQSGFCVRCGNRLPATGQTGQFGTGTSGAPFPTYVSSPSSAPTTGNGNSGNSLPTYASLPPSAPPATGPQPPSFPPTTGYPSPTGPSAPSAPWSTSTLAPPPPGPQMGSMQSTASWRRAFAGHGILVRHVSWLLPGDHAHATAVREACREKLLQRGVPRLGANPETLTERGLLMEKRDYVVTQRGIATTFTYVAPAGQDLYISRATTLLPAINNVFAALLIGIPILAIFGCSFLGSLAHVPFAGASLLPFFFFVYGVLAARCFFTWLIEKDFWQILRSRRLNDFQLDDWALLEHITDDVIHRAVEQVGLDVTKITAPPDGYQPKSKIRAI